MPPDDPRLELQVFANIDLRTVGTDLTAADLVERANPCLPGFDREFWARLGEPLRLTEAHGFPPLPDYIAILPYSARWLMLRQVVVTYSGPQEPERLRELIDSQPEFTGASIVEPPPYSATTPTDPLIAVAPAGTDPDKGRQQWLLDALDLPAAWDYGYGWTSVAVLDSGIERGWANQYPAGFLYHPEIDANVLRLNSWLLGGRSSAIDSFSIREPAFQENFNRGGHGTHVAGLVAAQANNERGGVGMCPGCGMAILTLSVNPESPGFLPAIRTGASVVNRSGSRIDDDLQCVDVRELDDELIPIGDYPWGADAPECSAARILYERQIPLFVSSGNDRRGIGWPARAPYAIAVGGTDINGLGQPVIWDDFGLGNAPPAGASNLERGTNFGPEQAFVAPARRVLSTFYQGAHWSNRCEDAAIASGNPAPNPPAEPRFEWTAAGEPGVAYEYCTGTSFSAPLVAGVAALVRSAQPMLGREGVIQAMRTDVESPFAPLHDDYWGFGIPQAGAAIARTLGRVGDGSGVQVQNRLTPLFHLSNGGGANGTLNCAGLEPQTVLSSGAHLFTTRPQVAVAAIANETYTDSKEIFGAVVGGQLVASRGCAPSSIDALASDLNAPPVRVAPATAGSDGLFSFSTDFQFIIDHPACQPQWPFFVDCRVARAWVYVFTTKISPFPDAQLIPLYRVGFDDIWPLRRNGDTISLPQPCPGLTRDFGYSTSRDEINNLWQNPASAIGDPCTEDDTLQQGPNTYFYDGQEGYLLDRCPESIDHCDGLEGRPIAVYLRRPPRISGEGGKETQNWALVPANRLPPLFFGFAPFSDYTEVLTPGTDGLIGYAFPNVDTDQDGLIDGQERLLGLDWNNPDSDQDGIWDGVEWSTHQLPCSNPATAAPGDAVLFRSGFESTFEVCDGQ